MAEYDLVVRNGTVATASDVFRADIGMIDGRIATIGAKLGPAAGRSMPRPHRPARRRRQPLPHRAAIRGGRHDGGRLLHGHGSAAFGGTTTVIPFAAQHRGMSLRQVVKDYHAAREPKAVIDYAFHLIISDPTEQVFGQELPALIKDGYTSFKIYMTYDALKLNDRQMLDVLALARREGALVMVHAENHDIIAWLSDRLLEAGPCRAAFHAIAHAPIAEREATYRAISLAELVDVPMLHRPRLRERGDRADPPGADARPQGLRRDLPAIPVPHRRRFDQPGVEGANTCAARRRATRRIRRRSGAGSKTGIFEVFSSDHAPYRFDDRRQDAARPQRRLQGDRQRRAGSGGAHAAAVLRRRRQGAHRSCRSSSR